MLTKELYSEEVEQSILGCVLVFEDSRRYIQKLEEEDFALVKNKEVFGLIKELYEGNKPITIITVKELAKSKNLNSKDVMNYLIDIQDNVITSANIEYYIKQLKSYSIKREIVKASKEMISKVYEFDTDVEADEIKKDMVSLITGIKTETIEKKECEMKDVMAETMEDIEKKYLKRDDLRYMTGFFELDKVTNGLHEQELTLIAARPGVR